MMWDDGAGFVTTSGMTTPYPEEFDLLEYLFEDRSPKCGFAVPRRCLEGIDLNFR